MEYRGGTHTLKDISSIINILPFKQRFSTGNSKIGKIIPDHYIKASNRARKLSRKMLSLQPNYLSETICSKHLGNLAIRQGYRNYREFSLKLESFIKGETDFNNSPMPISLLLIHCHINMAKTASR